MGFETVTSGRGEKMSRHSPTMFFHIGNHPLYNGKHHCQEIDLENKTKIYSLANSLAAYL